MHLTQDLAETFPDKADEIERLIREDARFEALVRRNRDLYLEINDKQRGLNPEEHEQRKKLEVERLGVLDEMALIMRGGKNAPSQARKEGRF